MWPQHSTPHSAHTHTHTFGSHPRSAPLEAVQAAAVDCVTPTFRAMVETAQDTLLGMHKQEWGGEGAGAEVAETSPYMRALVRHITHCRRAGRRGWGSWWAGLGRLLKWPCVLGGHLFCCAPGVQRWLRPPLTLTLCPLYDPRARATHPP